MPTADAEKDEGCRTGGIRLVKANNSTMISRTVGFKRILTQLATFGTVVLLLRLLLPNATTPLALTIVAQAWTISRTTNRANTWIGRRPRYQSSCDSRSASSLRLAAVASVTNNVTDVRSSQDRQTTPTLPTLNELQRCGRKAVAEYAVSDMFDPVSWLSNRHVQTIGGFLLRNASHMERRNQQHLFHYIPRNNPLAVCVRLWQVFQGTDSSLTTSGTSHDPSLQLPVPAFWDDRERVETPDGDWFHADTKYATTPHPTNATIPRPERPMVILLHGLASSSMSPVSRDMAQAIVQEGMDCVCLNFRGCSGIANDQLGGYHLGFTDDIRWYLERLRQQFIDQTNTDGDTPTIPRVYLAGYSLGANVVLKCLGELGASAVTRYHIQGAVTLCAPLDQTRNAVTLAQPGINRWIYTNNLLRSLQKRSFEQYQSFYGDNTAANSMPQKIHKLNMAQAMEAQTITEFDDAFIAPVYGFDDCWDYYRQTSSIHHLDTIAVPTLILNARDDPFFDACVWPVVTQKDDIDTNTVQQHCRYQGDAPIQMIRSERGGHLGYVLHQVDANDPRLTQPSGSGWHSVSWSADQMGRFFRYVQSTQQ